jgi:type I restriction enzyme S subunit
MSEVERTLRAEPLRRFKPYPAYKDSGVEWLGKIPAHWEVYALRRKLFREAGSIKIGPFGSALKLEFMAEEGFKVYGQEHVIARDFKRGSKYIDQAKFSELAACEIRPRDIVVTMMGSSGRCAVVPDGIEQGIMDSHLLRIRLPDAELDSRFLALLIDEADYVGDQIGAAGKGAIMHGLNSSIIKSIVLAAPPTDEQFRILEFLDRETARIDALVAKKERLIELLQEKRNALITRAVTKGLGPTVPMKDSGVEWLGEIPAHWEVKPLRWALSVRSGEALSNTEFEPAQEGGLHVAVIGGNGVMGYTSQANIHVPTIAIGRVGALCGNVHLVDPPAWITDNALVVSDIRGFDRAYLGLLLRVLDLNRWASQNAQPLITGGFVKAQVVCVPPVEEQQNIAVFLGRETACIDALVAKIHDAIDRLKELRIALISAAVTGKIDIREEVTA